MIQLQIQQILLGRRSLLAQLDAETVLPASHDARPRPEFNSPTSSERKQVLPACPALSPFDHDMLCGVEPKKNTTSLLSPIAIFSSQFSQAVDAHLEDKLSTFPALLVVVAALEAPMD